MSTTEPPFPGSPGPSRADRGESTTRGVVLEVGTSSLVVTVMPADGAPYRARVPMPSGGPQPEVRVGSHVELVIGGDPSEIRLAQGPPPAAR